jgi:hypothetical protein
MSGWISVTRDLWDHSFFSDAEMTEREAWLWMLSKAAWKDTRHRVGQDMIDVPRGSFMVTLREMQGVFMWKSDKRVRTFLKRLEAEGMIGRTTVGTRNAPKTHVTICNYDKFQQDGRTADAPKTHDGRTKDAVKEQDNNITNHGGEGNAREVSDFTDREAILSAIGVDPVSGIIGPTGKRIGTMIDMIEARRWFDDLGLTLPEIISQIEEVMRVKRDGPPASFSYFTKAMQRLADQKARPTLKPIEGGSNEPSRQISGNQRPSRQSGNSRLDQIARAAGLGQA